jgi:dihydrodipicolinate synthase/N-acetylneuraminate lyase
MIGAQEVEGIITPLFIPLDEEERVLERDLTTHVRTLLDRGIQGFLVPSGTGEFYNLTPEERRHAISVVAREAKGRVPVIAMAGECGTRNSLRQIAAAREAGADAVMANPPFYSPVDQIALKDFFNTLANEGGMPLWLYHQPSHTKVSIDPETVRELAANPRIVGIKASAWVDILYFQQLLRALKDRPGFRVFMGEDINGISGLVLGGHGMVSTLSNLIPDELVSLWKAIKTEDLATARRIQDRITDVETLVILQCRSWQGAGKYILKKRGIFSSTVVTSPSHGLTDADVDKLERRGRELGLF